MLDSVADFAEHKLTLSESEIHVWQAFLDFEESALSQFESVLSADEKARAARFRFARDREHFVAARGILRELMGYYQRRPPSAIGFSSYRPEAKPALQLEYGQLPIRFNLARSHGLAVFAFARGREVGIDVELIQPSLAAEETAQHFFSRLEIKELHSLPAAMRPEGFSLCWARKEAYVKARGKGLYIPLNSFSVSLTPGQQERLQSADSDRWRLRSFQPAPGFVGAIAAEGQDWELRLREWVPRKKF
jgi:4'-phosphopantetheinyl transferase